MIVVSDTTPLISLLKINRIDLLEKLFGEVMIPDAVFAELVADKRFQSEADLLLMDEAKGRNISAQIGLHFMGTIGVLMAAYEEQMLTSMEVRECVNGLQRAGRHIGQHHYQALLDKLRD